MGQRASGVPGIPLKGPAQGLLRLTFFEPQHWGSSLKGTRNIQGRSELSRIRARTGGAVFSHTEVLAEAIVSFLRPPSHRACRWVPYLSHRQPGYHCSPHPGHSLRPTPPNLWVHPGPFPVAFPYKEPVLPHASDFPKISQTSSIWPLHTLYILLSGPWYSISSSWPWFTAWPHLRNSKPSTSSSHL